MGFWDKWLPSIPDGVIASQGTFEDRVNVKWNKTKNASTYKIHRSIENDPVSTEISDWKKELEYNDLTALVNNKYSYCVQGKNWLGKGKLSLPAVGWKKGAGPQPTGMLNSAFLLPAKFGDKYGGKSGYCCTLNWMCRNNDTNNNEQRWYLLDYLPKIGSNFFPWIICNNDSNKANFSTPFMQGWGSTIHEELLEWMFGDRCPEFWGNQTKIRKMNYMPCLFLSNDPCDEFSKPHDWQEKLVERIVFWSLKMGVTHILTHWEAEKFVSVGEVNRIAGLIRKYSQNKLLVGTHATKLDFAKADLDFLAVQCTWNPWDGNNYATSKVTETIDSWMNAGAKKVHMMEYNVYSDKPQAKAQGQAALKNKNCIGVGNGW